MRRKIGVHWVPSKETTRFTRGIPSFHSQHQQDNTLEQKLRVQNGEPDCLTRRVAQGKSLLPCTFRIDFELGCARSYDYYFSTQGLPWYHRKHMLEFAHFATAIPNQSHRSQVLLPFRSSSWRLSFAPPLWSRMANCLFGCHLSGQVLQRREPTNFSVCNSPRQQLASFGHLYLSVSFLRVSFLGLFKRASTGMLMLGPHFGSDSN